MPAFDGWVQNELGLWVPGDGAEVPVVQSGSTVKAQTGQDAGKIPYITSGGVLKAPTLEGSALTINGDAEVTGELTVGGLKPSPWGNLLQESSGEYDLACWNVTGNAVKNEDSRYGGINILLGNGGSGEIFTAAPIYDPAGTKDYWLSFHVPYLAAGADLQYKVELWNDDNSASQGTLIDWTTVSSTGVHVVDLSSATWPSSPTTSSFLRVYFKASVASRVRLVSITPHEPTLPDPDTVAQRAAYYSNVMSGQPYNVGSSVSLSSGIAVSIGRARMKVRKGWRVKLGRVAWFTSDSLLRARIYISSTWTSGSSYGVETVNMTLRNTASADDQVMASIQVYNSSFSQGATANRADTITPWFFLCPF